jgi:glycosyltransferase involved in cell wall biosynthesis
MEVLLALSNRYGTSVAISVFGNEPDGPPLPHSQAAGHFEKYGQLRPTQIAGLLSETDIFLDMSSYQAMGLTAMEAMSCGAIPIVPQAGGATSFARHNHNSMVIDTSQPKDAVDCISQLIDNPSELARIRENAIYDVAEFHPEGAAFKILEVLFK